ncbi:protein adenylyltransferase SelO [Rhizobium rhizophilum]|uniref:Protein nucleotidyltransferase YdiU n=1 Tax=Rhizobium rhizophilum TaxID=1850373 RepID=A0ABY2QXL9_9HYPH|nr:YdiU family protein [Rhizobium rhizophilum]THV15594.1 YdiU family protein [Rhizobium rhizophilum]
MFSFDNSYARLPQTFHRPARPAAARAPVLIRFNQTLAQELGLEVEGASDARLAQVLSGQVIPVGAEPLAQAYAGHQFGQFNPQLGDGRALLLGEVIDREGRRRDIQLKGSGPTAFSRNGDGMAALGPVLREYIVSEAFAALGVPATRALAAVATGEQVVRETMLPGAVLTRIAASHIRVGTFQFFAAQGDEDAVQTLADHVIDRHYPAAREAENPYLAMLTLVAERQARLIARWLSIGFIHGVMNTDNMAISGETIDFGPCAFLDEYDPRKVFSSIDQRGRYAYANQPGIGQWNIARLAECLLPLLDADEEKALEAANGVLKAFGDVFQDAWLMQFKAKLGVAGEEEDDRQLVSDFLELMHQGEADFTLTFRSLSKLAGGAAVETLTDLFTVSPPGLADWLTRWHARIDDDRTPAERQAQMEAVNPALIARNHRIEEAIAAAIYGDFSFFHRLVEALATPYAEEPDTADLRVPPTPDQRVARTFCGT